MAGASGGGSSFGGIMGYSSLGMPMYHKGKIQKSWYVKSPLTNKFGGRKKPTYGKPGSIGRTRNMGKRGK